MVLVPAIVGAGVMPGLFPYSRVAAAEPLFVLSRAQAMFVQFSRVGLAGIVWE